MRLCYFGWLFTLNKLEIAKFLCDKNTQNKKLTYFSIHYWNGNIEEEEEEEEESESDDEEGNNIQGWFLSFSD